jgi:peroxiredoxin
LRLDYSKFTSRGAEILALGPDGPRAFRRFWDEQRIPFPGLPDLHSRVADAYSQEVNLFKLGRMPAIFLIAREGHIRYTHYGESMQDIPETSVLLDILDELNRL